MLLFTVGSSVREGDPRMMMMATFFLSPPVKIRLFLHVHPIVKRLTKTISINRDCDIKNPPNSSTKWTRNNNKWRAIYLLLSNAIPANVFIWKVSRLNRFLRNILCPLRGGGKQKSKKFGNGFFFLCLCISFDMKKRSGWCYFSTTPFIGHQQLKFRNPFFFSIFFLVRTQIQIRRKMNNGSKYYSSPTSLKRLKRPGNINNHSKRVYILNQKFFFFFPSLNNKRSPFCTPCLWLYNKNISASLSWNWNKITVFFLGFATLDKHRCRSTCQNITILCTHCVLVVWQSGVCIFRSLKYFFRWNN